MMWQLESHEKWGSELKENKEFFTLESNMIDNVFC